MKMNYCIYITHTCVKMIMLLWKVQVSIIILIRSPKGFCSPVQKSLLHDCIKKDIKCSMFLAFYAGPCGHDSNDINQGLFIKGVQKTSEKFPEGLCIQGDVCCTYCIAPWTSF